MKRIESLIVKYHQETVGTLALSVDGKVCTFEYDKQWHVPDFKLVNGKYFASRRFDISSKGDRIHTATAGGLLSISLSNPVLDYLNLLALTGYLTQSREDVEEMFRRMVFNYLMDNKDDHCKNFSFMVERRNDGKWHWHLAPAYDLTRCTEGYNGGHATSVNGTGHPTLDDMITVGVKNKMAESKCREIYEEVIGALGIVPSKAGKM